MSAQRGADGPMKQAREASGGPTRRRFNDRRLLKVYLDAPDFDALAAAAREDGKAVSEYVRRLIADDLAARSGVLIEITTEPELLPEKRSRAMANVRRDPPAEGACPHRKRAGELCYKCDEKMGYPVVR
jgi:hypothetical protein